MKENVVADHIDMWLEFAIGCHRKTIGYAEQLFDCDSILLYVGA
jgi:hypothetical protein